MNHVIGNKVLKCNINTNIHHTEINLRKKKIEIEEKSLK